MNFRPARSPSRRIARTSAPSCSPLPSQASRPRGGCSPHLTLRRIAVTRVRFLWGAAAALAALGVGNLSLDVLAQGVPGRAGGAATAPASTAAKIPGAEWTTYGANLASHRYSPLDQINKDNFAKLEIAWRLN